MNNQVWLEPKDVGNLNQINKWQMASMVLFGQRHRPVMVLDGFKYNL